MKNNNASAAFQSRNAMNKTVAKKKKTTSKKKWKKPKDKPKRPLSAYNLFFREERERLLRGRKLLDAENGTKIGFAGLAKHIANEWKKVSQEDRKVYESQAHLEQIRYKEEIDVWMKAQKWASVVISDAKPDQVSSVEQCSKDHEDLPEQAIQPECTETTGVNAVTVDIVKYEETDVSMASSLQSDTASQSRQQCAGESSIELKNDVVSQQKMALLFENPNRIKKHWKLNPAHEEIDRLVKLCKTQSYKKSIQQGRPLPNSKKVSLVQKQSSEVDPAIALKLMNYQYLQHQQQQQQQQTITNKSGLSLRDLLLLKNAHQERNNVQLEVARLMNQVQSMQQLSLVSSIMLGAQGSETLQSLRNTNNIINKISLDNIMSTMPH